MTNSSTEAGTPSPEPLEFDWNWFSDVAEPLERQSLCTRLFCFPCQCGAALTHACCTLNCDDVMTALCCCPCRTLFGIFPASNEKAMSIPYDEPEEIPYIPAEEGVEITYEHVFEMEQKRRKLMKATIT